MGGGMNPHSCTRQVAKILTEAGLGTLKLAAVAGDDVLPRVPELLAAGEPFTNFDTGLPLTAVLPKLASANVYLGAQGIVDALQQGAQIVITGRVADASLTVGPAVHEFGWKWDDWTRLAGATVAGHLIECGAQVTGGMFSAWTPALPLRQIGYPIAEVSDDGTCVITKPAGTDGRVAVDTVSEQLIYEINDPTRYFTPDVVADFSHVRLEQQGPDRVFVSGAQGTPRPDRFKVSLAYKDGYMSTGTLVICGMQAEQKARACADALFARLQTAGITPARKQIEILGTGDTLPGVWPRTTDTREVVLRIAIHDQAKPVVERFLREFAPLVTSGPGGVTGYLGPRPKPHAVFAYWPSTLSREQVTPTVTVQSAAEWLTKNG